MNTVPPPMRRPAARRLRTGGSGAEKDVSPSPDQTGRGAFVGANGYRDGYRPTGREGLEWWF